MTGHDGWWRHPSHIRKCKLAKEGVLDRVRERVAARERRRNLAWSSVGGLAIAASFAAFVGSLGQRDLGDFGAMFLGSILLAGAGALCIVRVT